MDFRRTIVYSLIMLCIYSCIPTSSAATFSMGPRRWQDNQNTALFPNTGGNGFRQMESEKQKIDGSHLNPVQNQQFHLPHQNTNAGLTHSASVDSLSSGNELHDSYKSPGFNLNPANPLPHAHLSSYQNEPRMGGNINAPSSYSTEDHEKALYDPMHSYANMQHPQQYPTEKAFESESQQSYDIYGNPIVKSETTFHSIQNTPLAGVDNLENTKTELTQKNFSPTINDNIHLNNEKVSSEVLPQGLQSVPNYQSNSNLYKTSNDDRNAYPMQNAALHSPFPQDTSRNLDDSVQQFPNTGNSAPAQEDSAPDLEDSVPQPPNSLEAVAAPVDELIGTAEIKYTTSKNIITHGPYVSQTERQNENIMDLANSQQDVSHIEDNVYSPPQIGSPNSPVVSEVLNDQLYTNGPEGMGKEAPSAQQYNITENEAREPFPSDSRVDSLNGLGNLETGLGAESSFVDSRNRNTDNDNTGNADEIPSVEFNDEINTTALPIDVDHKESEDLTTAHIDGMLPTLESRLKTDQDEYGEGAGEQSVDDDNTKLSPSVADGDDTEEATEQLAGDNMDTEHTEANDIENEVPDSASHDNDDSEDHEDYHEPAKAEDQDEIQQDQEQATTSENEYTKSANGENSNQEVTNPDNTVTETNDEESQTHGEEVTINPESELLEESNTHENGDFEGGEEVTQDPESLLLEENNINDIGWKSPFDTKYQDSMFGGANDDQKSKFGDAFVPATHKKSLLPFLMLLLLVILLLLVCSRMPSYFYSTWIAVKNQKFDHFSLNGKRSKRGYSALSMGDKSV